MVGKRIEKILFIVPPNTMPKDSIRRIGEPLGVLYLGAILKKQGYKVEVFDCTCEGYTNVEDKGYYITYGSTEEDIKTKLRNFQPDIVAVTCLFSAREADTLRVCRYIKDVSEDLPVVVGGIHPSLFPEKMLKSGVIDFVILGEGEFRLPKLIEKLNTMTNHFDFEGIAYMQAGEVIVNPASTQIDNLDTIPYPDRSLVDMERYIEIGIPYAPYSAEKRVAQILATRGCINRCNFCSTVDFWGRRIRVRSVENIIGELNLLKQEYGIGEIQFVDDNLTADKRLAKRLFAEMKNINLKWCTPHGLMFNTLDKEMIKLMAECGAYQLTFAIESASERVLRDIIHKNVRLDMVKTIVDEAHKYDIGVHGMFVVGFPGETRDEILSTLEFPFGIGFDSIAFFIINPMPGSELHDECIEKKYIDQTYSAMDFKTAHINIPEGSSDYNFSRQELEQLVDDKTREYNEYSKKLFPERWGKKFKRFLTEHMEHTDAIMGRIT